MLFQDEELASEFDFGNTVSDRNASIKCLAKEIERMTALLCDRLSEDKQEVRFKHLDNHGRAEVRSQTSWHVIDKTGSIVYFEGQPFDEMPADGSAEEDDKRTRAINAFAELMGMNPEDVEPDFDALVESIGGDIDEMLAMFGITLDE